MNRRQILKYMLSSALGLSSGICSLEAVAARLQMRGAGGNGTPSTQGQAVPSGSGFEDDYQLKMEKFYEPHSADIYVTGKELSLLESSWLKLKQVSDLVGYGNFHVVGFDECLKICARNHAIGALSADELAFLEEIFYRDAKVYGFFGERVFKEITCEIAVNDTVQLDNGHFLYQGTPVNLYKKLSAHIGTSLVMTSGIRSVAKQILLFMDKALINRGNLSLASRAIAPPGYSFHGCGDFDIGRYGWGGRNFTREFESTFEFKELYRLGYVKLRYPPGNRLGVRYEPWHVETTSAS